MADDEKMIVLQSSDGETFEVQESVAMRSETLKYMIEDDRANAIIPVPNVTSEILSKVIVYCKRHTEASTETTDYVTKVAAEEELKKFDEEFLKDVDQGTLFDTMVAAQYLDIRTLLDLTCQIVADMVKGKSMEEIRTFFHISNDYTLEEEAEIRNENAWAFD